MRWRASGALVATLGSCLLAGCTNGMADSSAVCDDASAALVTCGAELDESPFGTCQAAQRDQAAELLDLYDGGGCEALNDRKADGPLCSAFSFLCVEHSVDELAPFTTDGCSMFPDGTVSDATLWQQCCVTHDFAYYRGGTREDRADADDGLAACISEVTASTTFGNLMWAGVRVGGTPALPTPWRWGYGWTYDPTDGYRDLPADQVDAANVEIELYRADPWPPNAFEQRARDYVDAISWVPGLDDAIADVEAAAGEL